MTVLVVPLCFLAVTFTLAVDARVGKAEFSEPTQLGARPAIRSHGTTHVFGAWPVTTGPGVDACVGLGPVHFFTRRSSMDDLDELERRWMDWPALGFVTGKHSSEVLALIERCRKAEAEAHEKALRV